MKKEFLSFSEAKKYVQKLGFKTKNDWVQFSSVGRPSNIPSAPNITYKNEWVSWNDWFGFEKEPKFLSFNEAREYVHKLGFKSTKEWTNWSATQRPSNIPSSPSYSYKDEWISLEDWLGYDKKPKFLSFNEAREYVQKLGIKGNRNWARWSKSKRPSNIPSKPDIAYKNEWVSWNDWLGYNKFHKYLPFNEAREFVAGLGLKNYSEWVEWSKTQRPDNIPPMPENIYITSFKGYKHWLGHDRYNFLPFNEAREFVRKIGLKNTKEWQEWSKTERSSNIPSEPHRTYKNEWISMEDWLGYERKKFLPFEEARDIVRKLGLKTCLDWNQWSKTQRPSNIPSEPHRTYKNEWVSWNDWFGK